MDMLFLNLGDSIKGEATLDAFQNQIEVLSFSHEISDAILRDLTGRAGSLGRPKHQEFTLTKFLDLASTGLLSACNHGNVTPQAILTAAQVQNDSVIPVWVVTMKNVIVTSIAISGGTGGKPVETITLNYTAITWLYQTQTSSGQALTNSTSWDLGTNTEIK